MENDDETELVLFEEIKVETCYECEHFGVAECQEICEETAPDKPERAPDKHETGIPDEKNDRIIKNRNQVDMGYKASTVSVPENKPENSVSLEVDE